MMRRPHACRTGVAAGALAGALALTVSTAGQDQGFRFEDANGWSLGQRITQHHEMVRYVEQLAARSPRVSMVEQGRSTEGRRLLLAVVTSPEHQARLGEIAADARRLADPRETSPEDAGRIASRQPAIVWIGGSIHGFELSGAEGALRLLEHLATRDDADTQHALQNTVVLIDAMLNPDGRDAFATRNIENIGREPSGFPEDWANDFLPWEALKYRTIHYYFDGNRDWFAQTQPEIRLRARTIQEWRPQVAIDAHEMGPDVEFYFDPPTDPIPPYVPEFSRRWQERFGQAHAAAFDARGFEYTTRQLYNFFYPGYTMSWNSYQGAVGLLYEQGSSRGMALMRSDGTVRTLNDALENQYTAMWAAVRLAANERESFLREYYQAHVDAIADGRQGVRRYLIGPDGDPLLQTELAELLMRSGVEVGALTAEATLGDVRDREGRRIGSRTFPAGTYVVEAAQPRNRFIRTMLEPDIPLPEDFLEEARERVDRAVNPRFYDITAWSLPLLFNVAGYSTTDDGPLQVQRLDAVARPPAPSLERAQYAYLIDGRQAAAAAAAWHLRHDDYRVWVTLKATQVEGRPVPSGTIVVRVGYNPESVHQAVQEIARRFDLDVRAVDTNDGDPGFTTLGSTEVVALAKSEIAMLAEFPIAGYSFGWTWYVLDRQYRMRVTPVRVTSVETLPLDRFNVLVVPEVQQPAMLRRILGDDGMERLRRFVRDGGTLVGIGSGMDFIREHLELSALRSWYDLQETGAELQRFDVPGAIARVTLDGESWLASGYPDAELPVLLNSARLWAAPAGPPSGLRRIAAAYAADNPRLSGHAWPETWERIPGAVFAYEERIGRGRVIGFAEDVGFRGYWRGSDRIFLNAVVVGPVAP